MHLCNPDLLPHLLLAPGMREWYEQFIFFKNVILNWSQPIMTVPLYQGLQLRPGWLLIIKTVHDTDRDKTKPNKMKLIQFIKKNNEMLSLLGSWPMDGNSSCFIFLHIYSDRRKAVCVKFILRVYVL